MKRKLISALAVMAAMLCICIFAGMTTITGQAAGKSKSLDVMFLHDTHSHLEEFMTVEEGSSRIMGGFAKIQTLLDQRSSEALLVDAGDFSMGTMAQVVFEDVASEIRMLGQLGFEATTFGNHEFDYGAEGLSNMLNSAVKSGDKIPSIVVCNVDWKSMESKGLSKEQKLLKDAFETYGVTDYIVTEKNGISIAITGVFGKDCLDCAPECPLEFKDPVESVKKTVKTIEKKEDVDMIVCVSHSGTWEDKDKSEDEILAKSVPQLDLIISGHTHTKLDKPIKHGDTYIVSAAEYGKYLGTISMKQKSDGRWEADAYELVPVDESVEEDPEVQQKIKELLSAIDSKYLSQFGYTQDQVLCTNDIAFTPSSDLGDVHEENGLGSLMADAYTYVVNGLPDGDEHPVDVAVVPAGMVRDSYVKGNVTVKDVYNSFSLGIGDDGVPGYPLISAYLTGAELKMVAEIDASISDFMTIARLYTDGLCWNFNSNRMILNKVTDVYLRDDQENRVELEDDKLYRVVTDFNTALMLGGVTDMSYGLLSLVPKFPDGTPVEDYRDIVITSQGKEVKAWTAIASYMESFEDTDGDGIGNVPEKYETGEGRKVVETSKNPLELLKNPNKFFFMIIGIALVVLLLVAGLVVVAVKGIKKVVRRNRNKKQKADSQLD